MDKAVQYLKQWALQHVRNRDLYYRKIEMIEEQDDGFLVKRKDGQQHYYIIIPFLQDTAMLERLKPYELSTIVTVHCKENLVALVNSWKIFAQFKRMFSMMFVNPSSKTEKCWMLYPMTHDLVTEDKSLKAGLESIAMNVESVTKEAFLQEAAQTQGLLSAAGVKEAAHG